MKQNKWMLFVGLAFVVLILLTALSNSIFLTLQPGQKGVLFKTFSGGLETENIYGQGFHVIAPWNKMFVYDVRISEDNQRMDVLSKNGLNITIDLTYRFKPISEKIGFLHQEVGTDYLERILIPEIRSATREVIGKYLPEELYSTKRDAIQDEIYNQTKNAVSPIHLDLDAVLIKEVRLPEKLTQAIEIKLEEEQQSLQMQYRLTKEHQEAERRIIEAEAKAKANKILNQSLTANILKEKGIEATLELANSPNSKVIIVGGGGEGLPLILGNN